MREGPALYNLSVAGFAATASGLRLPASASCKVLHSRPAGRCPNNSSLFPPLAAVVVVALVGEPLAKGLFFAIFAGAPKTVSAAR